MPSPFLDSKVVSAILGTVTTVAILIYNTRKATKETIASQRQIANEQRIRHEEWQKNVDSRLKEHGERMDDHEIKIGKFKDEYVPRNELEGKLSGILKVAESTNEWVRTILTAMLHRAATVKDSD
jgi:hypothetical protein